MRFFSAEKWLFFFNMLLSKMINLGRDPAAFVPQTILCIKWDEIGDMAVCTHVFEALKKRYPASKISVIAKSYAAPLLHNNPFVDVIFTETAAFHKRYDLVVELRGTWSTLFKSLRYPPKMRADRGTVRYKQRGDQPHETLSNFRIVQPFLNGAAMPEPKIYSNGASEQKVLDYLKKNEVQNFAVIHAGARQLLRKWDAHKFAEIGDWLVDQYGLKIIFAGTIDEEDQIEEIAMQMKNRSLLFTRFGLTELAALLRKARIFIGNESGPLQIADTCGTPSIGLFGPGVPVVFYPRNSRSAVLHHVLKCNPCDQIHCVHPENPCIQRISVKDVKQSIESIWVS